MGSSSSVLPTPPKKNYGDHNACAAKEISHPMGGLRCVLPNIILHLMDKSSKRVLSKKVLHPVGGLRHVLPKYITHPVGS